MLIRVFKHLQMKQVALLNFFNFDFNLVLTHIFREIDFGVSQKGVQAKVNVHLSANRKQHNLTAFHHAVELRLQDGHHLSEQNFIMSVHPATQAKVFDKFVYFSLLFVFLQFPHDEDAVNMSNLGDY
jgi:membrane protein required for beta-lactamase induction